MLRNILLGAGVFAALFAVLMFSGKLPIGKNKGEQAVGEVILWGTLSQGDMESLLQSVNTKAKTYRISYTEIPEEKFSSTLLNALASSAGPDLILAPYQIILEQKARIYPFPAASLQEQQFRDSYVDGASILYGADGALALPVSIEPLMLFYNRALFSKRGVINAPSTWDEVSDVTPKFTIADTGGRILESAIALGTANNIPQAKDILMTLVMQLAQNPVTHSVSGGADVFYITADTPISDQSEVRPLTSSTRFYANFSDPNKTTYTWNSLMPQAQESFIAEKLAMYIGPLRDQYLLRAKNPRLDFGMKMLPQAKGYNTSVTGMSLYGVAVLKRTPNAYTALTAQALLGGGDVGSSIARVAHGVSPVRTVLASDTTLPAEVKSSVLVARGWYDASSNASTKYIQAMMSDIVGGRSTITDAVSLFISRMTDLYTPN